MWAAARYGRRAAAVPSRRGRAAAGSLRELDPLKEASQAITEAGKVGGTVGRKEAEYGIDVCPGQLQTGLYHSKQVGATGWQGLLQPAVEKPEGERCTLSFP